MGGQPNTIPYAAANKERTLLQLPAVPEKLLSDVQQLPSMVDAYAIPTEGYSPGIDAVHPSSGRMFQCTLLLEHDFNAGIFEILKQLDSSQGA